MNVKRIKRSLWGVIVAYVTTIGLLLPGCVWFKKTPAPIASNQPIRGLEVKETVEFSFPGDGQWHAAPYLGLHHHKIAISSLGEAAGLAPEAIQVKIGPIPQMIRNGQAFTITAPGRMQFRLDLENAEVKGGRITVQIAREE